MKPLFAILLRGLLCGAVVGVVSGWSSPLVESATAADSGPWQVVTLVGDGRPGDRDGIDARLNWPTDLVVTDDWTVYVADFGNHRIRKIDPDGRVSTLAGSGPGYADGRGDKAAFFNPNGLALGPDGNLYVADAGNARIRKVTPDGWVTTVAGDGLRGVVDGPGNKARFAYPTGLTFAPDGTLFVVDRWAHMVRAIAPDGQVRIVAGGGQAGFVDGPNIHARFNNPLSITWDDHWGLVVTDPGNRAIRTISPDSVVHTLVGGSRVPMQRSPFRWNTGVVSDGHGRLYVTDAGRLQVWQVDRQGHSSRVAGSGREGATNGPGDSARFAFITGIIRDPAGNLLLADSGAHQIRRLIQGASQLVFGPVEGQTASLRHGKVMPWQPHGQYRTGGLAHHFFGNAAQQHVGQGAAPVGAHDNQIRMVVAGGADDLLYRLALNHFALQGKRLSR